MNEFFQLQLGWFWLIWFSFTLQQCSSKEWESICDIPDLTTSPKQFVNNCGGIQLNSSVICTDNHDESIKININNLNNIILKNSTLFKTCSCAKHEEMMPPNRACRALGIGKDSEVAPKTFNIAFVIAQRLPILQKKRSSSCSSCSPDCCCLCPKRCPNQRNRDLLLHSPAESIEEYAKYLRSAWSNEICTTHVMVLMVDKFHSNNKLFFAVAPYLSIDLEEKFGKKITKREKKQLLSDLKDGFKDNKNAVQGVADLIKHLEYYIIRGQPLESTNIPNWAFAMLIFCAAFGLFLAFIGGRVNTSRTGSSGFKMGKNAGTAKKWKAGFSGGMWAD